MFLFLSLGYNTGKMEKELEEIIMKQLASDELSEEEKAYFEEWYKESSHQKYFQELLKIHSGIMAYSVIMLIGKKLGGKFVP